MSLIAALALWLPIVWLLAWTNNYRPWYALFAILAGCGLVGLALTFDFIFARLA